MIDYENDKKTKDKIEKFFDGDSEYQDLFFELYRYALTVESQEVVRFSNSIVGFSKEEGFYAVYFSKDEDDYYIKFKHHTSKETINFECKEDYKKEIAEAIRILNENPSFKIEKENKKNDSSSEYIDSAVAKYDELISEYGSMISIYAEEKINEDIFGRRVANALHRGGIFTIGDLISKRGEEIAKIEFLGRTSMRQIIDVLLVYSHTDIEAAKIKLSKKYDQWKEVRTRVDNIILGNKLYLDDICTQKELVCSEYKAVEKFIIDCISSDEKLTDRRRDILLKRIADKKTLRVIGGEYDISGERIRQIEEKESRKFAVRLKRGGNFNSESIIELLTTCTDEQIVSILYKFREDNIPATKCFFGVITDNKGKLNKYLDLYKEEIELKGYVVKEAIARHLPQFGMNLIRSGFEDRAIVVSKEYTDKYKKEIWSLELFDMLVEAYIKKGDFVTAQKFADVVKTAYPSNPSKYNYLCEKINGMY